MVKSKTEKAKPAPQARQAAPFEDGVAVMRIGGCFIGDKVKLTELSSCGRIYFGKFLTGPHAGQEFTCPVRAVKKA